MTKLFLLDTNIASHVIKGSVPAVRRHIERVPMAQLAISAVTESELRYGVARRPEATRWHAIVNEFLLQVLDSALGFKRGSALWGAEGSTGKARRPDREPRHDDWSSRFSVGRRARHERSGVQPE